MGLTRKLNEILAYIWYREIALKKAFPHSNGNVVDKDVGQILKYLGNVVTRDISFWRLVHDWDIEATIVLLELLHGSGLLECR
ncbi:hypothetical protein F0562_022508 [Nyssa sinensis]|uniref:Uncharacterized protein n=1 Tax=Nyssa sinensis TaxID=561372 RepID=A0A5J5BRV8_9ASTE|nr:hypothetical protein F0562_022508 [Nyssa sinensis]